MKKQLNILIAFSFLFTFSLQAQELEWAKHFGSSGYDSGRDIAVDPFDNVYAIGAFNYTVDFDSGSDTFNISTISVGDARSAYLSKMSANGDFLWAQSIGNEDDHVIVKAMGLDLAGNICIIGTFNGTVDFDPGEGEYELSSFAVGNDNNISPTSSPQRTPLPPPVPVPPLPPPSPPTDIFILKLNSEGGFVWARSIESNQYIWSYRFDRGSAIDVDALGDIYVTGHFHDTLAFGTGQNTIELTNNQYPNTNTFVCKYNSAGDFQWAKQFESTNNSYGNGNAIAVDEFNNTFISGQFSGQVDFDPSEDSLMITSNGQSDIFLTKLDQAGNLLWTKTIGGIGKDKGNDLEFDYNGNLFLTGSFSDTVNFNLGANSITLVTTSVSVNGFVLKLNAESELVWARQFASDSYAIGKSVSIDVFGNCVVAGSFSGILDANPGLGVFELGNLQNTFYAKLDAFGNFIWGNSIDGSSPTAKVNSMGDVLATGGFSSTTDFNPGSDTLNLSSNGSFDAFVLKLSNCVTFMDSYPSQTCTELTSPSGNYTWTESGFYNDYLANGQGCDTVFSIDLTVIETENEITFDIGSFTLSTSGINDSYQWLNCDDNYATVEGETGQSYQIIQNGNYAVEINRDGCVDTSACLMISGVGITENSFSERLSIFPNPTSGQLTVELAETLSNLTLTIWNAQGKLVSSDSFNSVERLNVEINGAAGIYLMELIGEHGESARFRIVKQ